VRIIVGSWTTVEPVTVPGLGYAEALLGIRASRRAAGRARRVVRTREVRLTRASLTEGGGRPKCRTTIVNSDGP
jgi:hypothetical protein